MNVSVGSELAQISESGSETKPLSLVKVVYQNSLHEQGDLREKPQNSQKDHFEGSVAENIKACLNFAKKHNSDLNTMRKGLWSNET